MEEPLVLKTGLEEILKKSAELMSRRGYHATTMRELARAANMSSSGLYHYCKGKEELIYLINFRGFSSLLKLAQELKSKDLSVENKLRELIRAHVHFFCTHRSDMRVMMFGTHEMDEIRSKKIRNLKESYRQICCDIVQDFSLKNNGQPLNQKELDRKTFLLFGMMNWIFGWYSSKKHGSEDELVEDIFSTFTFGVNNRKSKRNRI